MLRDPLNLLLMANIYIGKTLPTIMKSSEVIEKYVEALRESDRLQSEDLRLLEKQLVPLMIRKDYYSNEITVNDLDDSDSDLYDKLYSSKMLSDGRRKNQSFLNLLDAGILESQDRGLERSVLFKYERFYEYFAGKRIFTL